MISELFSQGCQECPIEDHGDMELVYNSQWYNNYRCSKCKMIVEQLLILKSRHFCESCLSDALVDDL